MAEGRTETAGENSENKEEIEEEAACLDKGIYFMAEDWSPHSWRTKPVKQAVFYPNAGYAAEVENILCHLPPLVARSEVLALCSALARAEQRRVIILQGGACAESFAEFRPEGVSAFRHFFEQMAQLLAAQLSRPVIKIGRIAGQFAKPRSAKTEKRGDLVLPVFRGDAINSIEFTEQARMPDPGRMVRAYEQSAAILRQLRCSLQDYEENLPFFTSHEALLLPYEEALTRKDNIKGSFYNSSAHMIWIGDRTRQENCAHVEYCRGIINPIGLKCGVGLKADMLLRLADIVNPQNIAGRLVLITRFGFEAINVCLPPLIRAIQREGRKLLWLCDPMHGNNRMIGGHKTRFFENIMRETERFFAIHAAEGSYAGGLHLEMTEKNVTECLGGTQYCSGAGPVAAEDLPKRYQSLCDPRLNGAQALELAHYVARILQ